MGNLHNNIQLMLEFLKGPFFVLHLLSIILLSMLMILLYTLNVIWHLIYGKNYNWLLNLDLIYEALWTRPESCLLISMLEKHN